MCVCVCVFVMHRPTRVHTLKVCDARRSLINSLLSQWACVSVCVLQRFNKSGSGFGCSPALSPCFLPRLSLFIFPPSFRPLLSFFPRPFKTVTRPRAEIYFQLLLFVSKSAFHPGSFCCNCLLRFLPLSTIGSDSIYTFSYLCLCLVFHVEFFTCKKPTVWRTPGLNDRCVIELW